jgi:hypothetical protein
MLRTVHLLCLPVGKVLQIPQSPKESKRLSQRESTACLWARAPASEGGLWAFTSIVRFCRW